MSDRIKNWWRIYGDLAAHIPKPVWDELDAAIRADERQRTSPPHDPSGEGVAKVGHDDNKSPETLVIPVQVKMGTDWWVDTAEYRITITPTLARRIVAMGQ